MKLKMPMTVSWVVHNTYAPGEWGTGVPLRRMYIPILYGSTLSEVEVPSVFIGSKGPRMSQKPVFHKKPVGVTDVPLLMAEGHLLVPYWEADSHNYMSWYAMIGCTACFHALWSRNYIEVDIRAYGSKYSGGARRCTASWQVRMESSGVVRVTGTDWPLTKLAITSLVPAYLPKGTFPKTAREWYPYATRLYRGARSWLASICNTAIKDQFINPSHFRWGNVSSSVPSVAPLDAPPDLLHEEDRALGQPVIHPSGWYHEYARQHAFLAACEALPTLSDNMISNILEVGSFIYELVENKRVEVPKSLSSAWLAYRYQYMTTKLDVAEAISFVGRHTDELLRGPGLKSYGSSTFDYDGCSVTCRCTIRAHSRELSMMRRVWSALSKYGLAPDFYAIWDMVPYSFIADWFVPVGAMLDVLDATRLYNPEHYDFDSIVYSIKYVQETSDGIFWSVYRRWVEATPPELEGLYWWEPQTPSSKVGLMRALDSVALIRG